MYSNDFIIFIFYNKIMLLVVSVLWIHSIFILLISKSKPHHIYYLCIFVFLDDYPAKIFLFKQLNYKI